MTTRKKTSIALSGILIILLTLVLSREKLQLGWANADVGIFPTILKTDVAANDLDEATIEAGADDTVQRANVLFLIDTSNAMLFSSVGKMPDWDHTQQKVGNDWNRIVQVIAPMVKELTYGIGGRPAVHLNGSSGHSRAGRDVDPTNNDPTNPDCYYSPDTNRPYLLTFQPEHLANSKTLPSHWTQDDLMPNDSRLYKMKLVFWRIFQDRDLRSKLRYALATTHVSVITGTAGHIFYKRLPHPWEKHYPAWDATREFPHGRIYTGYTSPPGTGTQYYSLALNVPTQWAIATTATNAPQESLTWLTVKRGYLRVPFGEDTFDHREKFLMLMDGIEDNSKAPDNSSYYFTNPELTTSGASNLATAIYAATAQDNAINAPTRLRDIYINRGLIYYSDRNLTIVRDQTDGINGRHIFAKGSGEATGSVIDFFSPAIENRGYTKTARDINGKTPFGAIAGNFPIRNSCEPNWLVIFTAGDDVSSPYTSDIAVKHLYNYTKKNKVVRIKDPTKPPTLDNLAETRLFKPIRTMVIGFVDPTKKDSDPNVKALVKKLNDMADYGDDGIANGSATAYFANDVPGLIRAMRQVLLKITSEIHASSTPIMVTPGVKDGNTEEPEAYATGYKHQSNDQWRGYFERHKIIQNASGDLELKIDWDLSKLIEEYISRDISSVPEKSGRRLYTWDWTNATGSQMTALTYPGLSPAPYFLAPLMGLTPMDIALHQPGTPHPSNLMARWLLGSDYSYGTKTTMQRTTPFPDMGNAGYSLVPTEDNSKRTLFLHTNDGLLHAVDVGTNSKGTWDRERWAFIPPNVLANQRLAGLKFNFPILSGKRKAQWINGPVSNAAFLTDGSVQTFNLLMNPTDKSKRTLLTGSMGRGGTGLYALDVTSPDIEPKFLWAIENDLYTFKTNSSKGKLHEWNAKSTIKHQQTPYTGYSTNSYNLLGFNAPPPAIATTMLNSTPTPIGVLAAGMQYDLDLTHNGTFGSAIYIFDPFTGKLIRAFSSYDAITSSNGELPPHHNPQMGMVLTPPVLMAHETLPECVTGFLTADNRGQIFEGSFLENGSFVNAALWRLQRIATIKRDSEQGVADNFCIPHRLSLFKNTDEQLWIFGGTADMLGKKGTGTNLGVIFNKEQLIFGFKKPKPSAAALCLRDPHSVKSLNKESKEDCIDPVDKGWIIPLEGASVDVKGREYLTTSTVMYGDTLYAATFIPKLSISNVTCAVQGNSRLYLVNGTTGKGIINERDRKYLNFDGIKVGGITAATIHGKTRLFISIAILNDTGFNTGTPNSKVTANEDYKLVDATLHASTLMSIALPTLSHFDPEKEKLQYWREVFP